MMRGKNILFIVLVGALALTMAGCTWFYKKPTRETIFDKVVTTSHNLVFNIPKLPPLCDEISDLKKGFAEIESGKLYYEEEGRGIPLVLINGGPGNTHHIFHKSTTWHV